MKKILITASGSGASNNLINGIRYAYPNAFIIGVSIDKFYLAMSLANKNYLVPRADKGERYIESLKHIIAENKVDVLIPNNDAEIAPVARVVKQMNVKTYLPNYNTITLCQDKYSLNTYLSKCGLNVAESYLLSSINEIEDVFSRFKNNNVLWCRMRKGSASKGSLPVKSVEQVRFWIKYWTEMRGVNEDSFMLCDYLPGRDYAFQSMWRDGKLIIAKTCERLSYLVRSLDAKRDIFDPSGWQIN